MQIQVALLSLALASGAVAFAAEGSEDFARIVADYVSQDNAELDRRAAELSRQPNALASFFTIGAANGLPGPDGVSIPLTASQMRLLTRAVNRFDSAVVLEYVRNGLSEVPNTQWRRTALRFLGRHARSSDLSLLSRVALEGRESASAGELAEPFQEALTSVLRRFGSDARELDWLASGSEPLEGAIVRAVGMAGDPEGLPWLVIRLENPEHGTAALQEIGRLAPEAPSDLASDIAWSVHPLLRSSDESRRKQALRALGALGDPSSVPLLLHVLEQGASRGERRMAYAALREISGIDLPPLADAWKSWHQGEQRWFQEEAAAAVTSLSSENQTEVISAVQRLSAHSLYRDRIAAELAPLLAAQALPSVRIQVCLALARLGSDVAMPELVEALKDEDLEVRRHARIALRSIAGRR